MLFPKLKVEGKPVHLFKIGELNFFVVRMDFFAAVKLDNRNTVAVVAPPGISYQQAAMKAARQVS